MAARKPIDWEAVEASYRSGSPSIRALAEIHGLTEGAIRKKATKEAWARDLSEKVLAATKDKLSRNKVRTESTQRTDAEIVEDEAELRVGLVVSHRAGLARWRVIAEKLCDALSSLEVGADNLGDFSRALNAGVDAQLKVIKGERQAYNLDEGQPIDGPSTVITRVERVIIDAPKHG